MTFATLLERKERSVIMEMANRTTRYDILRARKELKNVEDDQYGNIFINKSLCDPYKGLPGLPVSKAEKERPCSFNMVLEWPHIYQNKL